MILARSTRPKSRRDSANLNLEGAYDTTSAPFFDKNFSFDKSLFGGRATGTLL
jgi:hypothetical protein